MFFRFFDEKKSNVEKIGEITQASAKPITQNISLKILFFKAKNAEKENFLLFLFLFSHHFVLSGKNLFNGKNGQKGLTYSKTFCDSFQKQFSNDILIFHPPKEFRTIKQ